MKYILHDYQNKAIEQVKASLKKGLKRIIIDLSTGAGKTAVACGIIEMALGKGKRVCFICNRIQLIQQSFDTFWYQGFRDIGIIQGANTTNITAKLLVCSIQTLNSRGGLPEDVDLIILDEAHGVAGSSMYWPIMKNITCVGLSATCMQKGLGRHMEGLGGNLFQGKVKPIAMKELIEMGFLVPMVAYGPNEVADLSKVRTVAGEYKEDELGEAMNKTHLVGDVVKQWFKHAHNKQTMAFCVTIAHSMSICEAFQSMGINAVHVDYRMTDDQKKKIYSDFKAGKTMVLCNCALLSEGSDFPAAECLVLARPTKSEVRYIQMCLDSSTEILTMDGWKGIGDVSTAMRVAAFNIDENCIKWERPSEVIERGVCEDEEFYEINSPHLDIRVTGGHDIVFKGRNSDWSKLRAEELCSKKSGYIIPVSSNINNHGIELTDDEIRFIGLFITDGCLNKSNNTIYFSQSLAQPISFHEYIKNTINGCGIKFGEYRSKRKGDLSQYEDMMVYTMSKGMPKTECGKTGWNAVFNDSMIDKQIPEYMLNMNRRQLGIFLEAINLGNGCKFKTVTWTPKTMSISTGNKNMADRLQALCVINGYRCNISTANYNLSPLYILRICDKTEAHVGGANSEQSRSRLSKSEKTKDDTRVWCVTVESGNIVTRRNGKVAIMGNCGRVLRTSPGKERAIVLDHGGCIARFGFPDDIHVDKLDDGKPKKSDSERKEKEKEEPKPKECPQCKYLMRVGMKVCVSCGWSHKPKGTAEHSDEDLIEIQRRGVKKKTVTKTQSLAQTECDKTLAMLKHYAHARGYKDGWYLHKYKEVYGYWPKGNQRNVAPIEPSPELLSWLRSQQIKHAKSQRSW